MRWELLPWQHGEEGNKGGDGQGKGHRVGRGRMGGMGRGRRHRESFYGMGRGRRHRMGRDGKRCFKWAGEGWM